jgi:amidohydrolase
MPETGTPSWRSLAEGKMHACGHDGHTAMLLGAAAQLAEARDFSGTVYFVFQPAEEGRGGAAAMIKDGLFERFAVDAVYGLHNMPGLDVDQIAAVEGPQLASSDSWAVTFRGAGTHGAKPHLGRDAIAASGQFLSMLHTIVAREVDPLQPAVVSACALRAGNFAALNVIPDFVEIGGTARAYTREVRNLLEHAIGRLARGTAEAFDIAADYTFTRRIPPVVNASAPTAVARAAAVRAVGADKVLATFPPSTAGDDFADFAAVAPGCYVWLGNGPATENALHHNTGYDFNDAAIRYGIRYWCEVVRGELGN